MTTMLTDDELDALLTGAADRLHAATDRVTIGAAPSPSLPTGTVLRVAAAVVVVGGAAAGLLAVGRGDGAGVPAAFISGDFGTEIVLRREDDGDGDPNTERLVLDPGGQSVRVLSGPAALAFGSGGDRCWVFASRTATCVDPTVPSVFLSGTRGPQTVVLVQEVPDDVVAVAFEAGDAARYWVRPVDRTAAFPFPLDATSAATATLVRADGTAVDVLETIDGTPTEAERTTRTTDETLASIVTLTEPPRGFTAGDHYVRTRGRADASTGFAGPFVLQTWFRTPGSGNRSTIAVLTVNERSAEDARVRLRRLATDGGLRGEQTGDGVLTFVWAGTDVTDETVSAVMAALRAGRGPAMALDLDRPWSWIGPSDTSMFRFLGQGSIDQLLFDRLRTVAVDGVSRTVVAGGDDRGEIQFWFDRPDGSSPDPSTGRGSLMAGVEPSLPEVGVRLSWGLWPVPASTETLTLTLDDGTTFTPQLVDARPAGDAKLAVIPAGVTDRAITAVSST